MCLLRNGTLSPHWLRPCLRLRPRVGSVRCQNRVSREQRSGASVNVAVMTSPWSHSAPLPRRQRRLVHPLSHFEYVSCIALCLLPGTRQVLRKLLWQEQSRPLVGTEHRGSGVCFPRLPCRVQVPQLVPPSSVGTAQSQGPLRCRPGDQPKRRQIPASCHSNSSGKTDSNQKNKSLERDSWQECHIRCEEAE